MKRRTPFIMRRRQWPSTWLSNRPCACPPHERLIEADATCYRCGGKVQRRAPFRANDWRADG